MKAFRQRGGQLVVHIVPRGERVSHLLYANNVLNFAEATRANADKLQSILKAYFGRTGQRINQGKYAIIFNKRCPLWKRRRIANFLGIHMVTVLEYL